MEYRRMRVAGGGYFFTMALADRKSDLLTANIDALRAAVKAVKASHPFIIDAMVVMPDHIHALCKTGHIQPITSSSPPTYGAA